MHIWFKKLVGFIKIYDEIIYFVSFGSKQYDSISNTIRQLLSKKSGITDIISHEFAKIKIDSYNYLPRKKRCFFILQYLLSRLLKRMKTTATIYIHF